MRFGHSIILALLLLGLPSAAFAQAASSQDSDGNIQFTFNGASSIKVAPAGGGVANQPCPATSEGAIRYNSTLKSFEGCDGTRWSGFTNNIISASLSDSTPSVFSGPAHATNKRVNVDRTVTITRPSVIIVSGSSSALLQGPIAATGTVGNITSVVSGATTLCIGGNNNLMTTPGTTYATLIAASSCIANVSPGTVTITSSAHMGQHDIIGGTMTHQTTILNYTIIPN